jgi:SP family general alpha glucoside:H+ symporter-like MFS transporter
MEKGIESAHVETTPQKPNVVQDASFNGVSDDARAATDVEHHMGLLQALRLYPKAVGWSILLSTAIVMEGYDTVLINNFYALPQFNQKYGQLQPDGTYVISAAWKSGLSNAAGCGEILGLFITGILQDRFGHRKTILGALCMIACTIFIVFFAQNIQMLLVGEILCGIPWGVFQTLTTAYACAHSPSVPISPPT